MKYTVIVLGFLLSSVSASAEIGLCGIHELKQKAIYEVQEIQGMKVCVQVPEQAFDEKKCQELGMTLQSFLADNTAQAQVIRYLTADEAKANFNEVCGQSAK